MNTEIKIPNETLDLLHQQGIGYQLRLIDPYEKMWHLSLTGVPRMEAAVPYLGYAEHFDMMGNVPQQLWDVMMIKLRKHLLRIEVITLDQWPKLPDSCRPD